VRHSAFSHSGEVLALNHGAPPVNLSIVDAITGEILRETRIEVGGSGGRMDWTPTGALAVVEKHSLRIYSGELEVLGQFELTYACDVAFSPCGGLVAIGSWKSGRVLPVTDVLA